MADENAKTSEYQDSEKQQVPFHLVRESEPTTCRRCGACYCGCSEEELDAGGPA